MKKQIIFLCGMLICAYYAHAANIMEQIDISSQTNHCSDSKCIVKINISNKKNNYLHLSNVLLVSAEGESIHSSCRKDNCLIVSKLNRTSQKLKISLNVNGEERVIDYDYELPQHL
ncbi:hypothetical protein [Aquella oligotrophica]|uniref:Uncharacterized protein n=1 Tax=Aquella oligotrophica TaxID=2067065 RepID=A0A2I7N8K5_9NEIS|nr:hypothetical protein [Aquella oligotrophica]AUR52794.1 hypothetical protein CUN60_10985 [Aquella oligotrophica]